MNCKDVEPLYYAIIRLFADRRERTPQNVLTELEPIYSERKLFTRRGIDEALATAKENGLLEEANYCMKCPEGLSVSYAITDFGEEMLRKYLQS